ncbi:MAG: hypothetical protein H0W72_05750 [Planctomycetes bacterium]|nr:hypothetical protein [Planctomycetota bacterium]
MPPCVHPRLTRRDGQLVCADCAAPLTVADTLDRAAPSPWRWRQAHSAVAAGLAIAIAVRWFDGLPTFIVDMLGVLAHEIGHAAVALAVARPALPSFDLFHGGGVTHIGERSMLVLLAYAGGALWLGSRLRDRPRLLIGLGVAATIYALAIWLEWEKVGIAGAGIVANALLGGVFVYRALTGSGVVHGGVERWLYAIVGWMLILQAIGQPWGVIHDAEARELYLEGKAGLDNDMVVISDEHGWELESVAWWLVAITGSVPGVALALGTWRGERAA